MIQYLYKMEVSDIDNVLIKFKHVEDMGLAYIEAAYTKEPDKYIRLVKEAEVIEINSILYAYCSNDFVPAFSQGNLDVVHIYLEEI